MQDNSTTIHVKSSISERSCYVSQGNGLLMSPLFLKTDAIAKNQDTSIFLLQTIKRPGIESLLDYMLESDYFTAPASTRFHNSFPGGPCLHSLNFSTSPTGSENHLSPLLFQTFNRKVF